MELQHDKSWDCFNEILAARLPATEAWNRLIDFHEQILPKPYWSSIRKLDLESEQLNVVEAIHQLVTDEPVPPEVVAFWVGMLKFMVGEDEVPAVYLAGANSYNKDDIDWACDAFYLPVNRYLHIIVLQQIDDIIKGDKDSYGYLDWILPIACSAFMYDEIIRNKLNKDLFLRDHNEIHVALGYDNGDYVDLSSIYS